ncbi:hypothetical protein ACKFKG_26110 [Phormidesmis sp. 146-35]
MAKSLPETLIYLHHHQPPVIHRDIKPSNVLLGDRSGNPVRFTSSILGRYKTSQHQKVKRLQSSEPCLFTVFVHREWAIGHL